MQSMTAFPFTSVLTYDEHGWPQLDRGVTSEVLRKLLKSYYTNGVFGIADSNCLQVMGPADASSPTVRVKPGVCLINGATGYTEEIKTLDLTAGDTTLPRIDTVVCRLNDNSDYRNIYLDIILGTPASTPVAPALTQTDSVWEIGLANIYRAANSTVVRDTLQLSSPSIQRASCSSSTLIMMSLWLSVRKTTPQAAPSILSSVIRSWQMCRLSRLLPRLTSWNGSST